MTIAAISDNPICVAISEAMLQWLAKFRNEMVHVPGKERVTIGEHRKILDCIAAHDPDQAAQAMESHLKRASELYKSAKGAVRAPQLARNMRVNAADGSSVLRVLLRNRKGDGTLDRG